MAILPPPSDGLGGRHVALYVRVSTDAQAERGVSLDAQEAELRREAAARWPGLPVVVYHDDASAYSDKHRPDFTRLLDTIAEGAVAVVAAHAQDRLLRRKVGEWEAFCALCAESDTAIYLLDAGFVDDSPDSELLGAIRAALARRESAIKSRRVRSAKAAIIRQGGWIGGPVPTGYRRGEDRVLVHTEHAPAILEAFERLDRGASIREIAAFLTEATGETFSRGRTQYTLRNPVYIGLIPEGVSGKRGRVRARVHEGAHEPIVPRDLFARVQKTLDERSEADAHTSRVNPFATVVRCGECKQALRFKTVRSGGRWRERAYFQCERPGCGAVRIPDEFFVGAVLFAFSATAFTLRERLDDPAWAVGDDAERVEQLRDERDRLEGVERDTLNLLSEGLVTAEAAKDALDGNLVRRREIEIELARLTGDQRRELEELRDALTFAEYEHPEGEWANPVSFWLRSDFDTRQRTIARLLDRIDVFPADETRVAPADYPFDVRSPFAKLHFKAGVALPIPLRATRRGTTLSHELGDILGIRSRTVDSLR